MTPPDSPQQHQQGTKVAQNLPTVQGFTLLHHCDWRLAYMSEEGGNPRSFGNDVPPRPRMNTRDLRVLPGWMSDDRASIITRPAESFPSRQAWIAAILQEAINKFDEGDDMEV